MSESSLTYSHCKRCNRTLKNPRAQEIGYGKICYEKHKAEAEQKLKNGIERGEYGQESLTAFVF